MRGAVIGYVNAIIDVATLPKNVLFQFFARFYSIHLFDS